MAYYLFPLKQSYFPQELDLNIRFASGIIFIM